MSSSGSLLLVLHSHLPYVLRHGRWPHGVEWLLEAAAECYLPIVVACSELRRDGIEARLTLSLSPVLVEQLADEEFPGLFEEYLEDRAERAESDRRTFLDESAPELAAVAEYWRDWYRRQHSTFVERCGRDILGAIRDLRDAGTIGLQTCGATHGYFPLLGNDSSIHAQIQVALDAHWRHFRHRPRGIWMPECAYRPAGFWRAPTDEHAPESGYRAGVEALIAAGGMDHTVVDAHSVRGAEPINWYSSRFGRSVGAGKVVPLDDPRSLFDSYRIASSLNSEISGVSVFPRHVETALRVWSSKSGLPGNGEYLEFHKKYHASGHRYWSVTDRSVGLDGKQPYRPEEAEARAVTDGRAFARHIERTVAEYRNSTGREGTICLPFDTELFGHWWHEGPTFLATLLRELGERGNVVPRTTVEQVDRSVSGLPIALPESSWGDGGDHRVWFNDETAWTWPVLWRAEHRFGELVASRDRNDRMQERALKQAARSLLLLQASDWQFLITTGSAADYATDRIRGHEQDFHDIADFVELRRSGVERQDLFNRLCRIESIDRLFPALDLDHWQWKRADEALAAPPEGSP